LPWSVSITCPKFLVITFDKIGETEGETMDTKRRFWLLKVNDITCAVPDGFVLRVAGCEWLKPSTSGIVPLFGRLKEGNNWIPVLDVGLLLELSRQQLLDTTSVLLLRDRVGLASDTEPIPVELDEEQIRYKRWETRGINPMWVVGYIIRGRFRYPILDVPEILTRLNSLIPIKQKRSA